MMAGVGLLMLAAAGLGLPGCADAGAEDDGRLTVVATTTMIADAARVIAGDDVRVISIMKAGEDPHGYDVRPSDAETLRKADVVLLNGFHLEATLTKIVEEKATGLVVELAPKAGVEPISGMDGLDAVADPHCWMDVALFKLYAQEICDALVAADPDHEVGYRERTQAYLVELDELDGWIREQLAAVPQAKRAMVTSHDAFNYYARAYGVRVYAVVGISTEQAHRAGDVDALIDQVRSQGIRALFIETSVSDSLNNMVRQVADHTGTKIGGELYSDSLGEPDEDAGTYIGMMRHNTETIVEALR